MATAYTWADAAHSRVMAVRDGGLPSYITASPDNGDYQALVASGAPIGAYAEPSPAAPAATPYQVTLALNAQGSAAAAAFDAALAKAKPSDRMRWNARTEPLPADNPVFVRLCGLASADPVPLHALAVGQ